MVAEQQARVAEKEALLAKEVALQSAKQARNRADWQTYVARMQQIMHVANDREYGHLDRLLQNVAPEPGAIDYRGWEWRYYQNLVNAQSTTLAENLQFTQFAINPAPDATQLVTTQNGRIQLWDYDKRKLIGMGKLRHSWQSPAVSPDGKLLAYGNGNGRVVVYDLTEQTELRVIDAHSTHNEGLDIRGIAWNPNGDGTFASACRAGDIKLWNANTGELVRTIKEQEPVEDLQSFDVMRTESLDWHPVSGLASGHRWGNVTVWNVAENKVRWRGRIPNDGITRLCWSPSGEKLLAGRTIWSKEGRQLQTAPIEMAESDRAVAWQNYDRFVVTQDHTILFVDAKANQVVSTRQLYTGAVSSFAFDRLQERLITASWGREILLTPVDREKYSLGKNKATKLGHISDIAWSPDDERFATQSQNSNKVFVWDAETLESERELINPGSEKICELCWSSDGELIVGIDFHGNIVVWDVATGEVTGKTKSSVFHSSTISINHRGDRISICGNSNCQVYSFPDLELLFELPGRIFGDTQFTFDDEKLAVCTREGFNVYDATNGKSLHSLKVRFSSPRLDFSSNGKWCAVANETIQILDVESLEPFTKLKEHRGNIRSIAFSPDSLRLALGSADGTIRIWDTNTVDEIVALNEPDGVGVTAIAWSHSGEQLLAATEKGVIYRLDARLHSEPAADPTLTFLQNELLKSVKADEKHLAELNRSIEQNPEDLALLRERIVLLQKLRRWLEALADVERHIEMIPGDTWRPAQGLMLANMVNDAEKIERFATRFLEIVHQKNDELTAQANAALSLAMAPQFVEDYDLLLKVTREFAAAKPGWRPLRPYLLTLLRAGQYDELKTQLAPRLANAESPPPQRSLVLMLEALRLQFTDQTDEARKVFQDAQDAASIVVWERTPLQVENAMIVDLLMREFQKTFGVEDKATPVSTDDFEIAGSWKTTVEFDESKRDEVLAALIEDDNKRNPKRPKLTTVQIKDRREFFEKMIELSTKSSGTIIFQANGELRAVASLGGPPTLPGGMIWRLVEQVDDRLLLEFRQKNGDANRIELKIVNGDLLESLPTKGKSAFPEVMQKATRTTWARVKTETIEGAGSVAKWLQLLNDESEEVRTGAMNAIPTIGSDDVPLLIQTAFRSRRPEVRRGVDRALSNLVKDPKGDVGDWIALLQHESELVSQFASRVLFRFGEKALPDLFEVLKDDKPGIRRLVIFTLMEIGTTKPSAAAAIDSRLAEVLKNDTDPDVRNAAVMALGRLRQKSKGDPKAEPAILSDLIESLTTDESKSVRIGAAQAIGTTSAPNKAAVDALAHVLVNDEDDLLRHWAADAIGKLGPAASDGVPALLKAVQSDPSDTVRHSAVYAIGRISPKPDVVLTTLVAAIQKDKGLYVRMRAAEVVGGLGPAANEAVPVLVAAMKNDKSDSVRSNAAVAIGRIGSLESIPEIIEVMQSDKNEFARSGAARALAEFGPAAKEAIPALKQARDSDKSDRVKTSARLALRKIAAE